MSESKSRAITPSFNSIESAVLFQEGDRRNSKPRGRGRLHRATATSTPEIDGVYPSTIKAMPGFVPILVGIVVGAAVAFGAACDIRRAFALRRESRQGLRLIQIRRSCDATPAPGEGGKGVAGRHLGTDC